MPEMTQKELASVRPVALIYFLKTETVYRNNRRNKRHKRNKEGQGREYSYEY